MEGDENVRQKARRYHSIVNLLLTPIGSSYELFSCQTAFPFGIQITIRSTSISTIIVITIVVINIVVVVVAAIIAIVSAVTKFADAICRYFLHFGNFAGNTWATTWALDYRRRNIVVTIPFIIS